METANDIVALDKAMVEVLKSNAWIIIVICVAVIIALYMVIGLITWILKLIFKRFENIEYFEFGKLKIKNRYYRPDVQQDNSNTNNMGLNRYVDLIDMVISNKVCNISKTIIENIVEVNKLENDYEHNSNIIFKTTFSSVISDFHENLITYACKATGFSIENINKTREYFFISNMLKNLEKIWIEKSKTILERNGFIQILEDVNKADKYIEELNNCIPQSIEIRHLEVTAMKMNEIEDIIEDLFKSTKIMFRDMFNKLGELKKNAVEKRKNIMNKTNESVTNCVSEIMNDIIYKIFDLKSYDASALQSHHDTDITN